MVIGVGMIIMRTVSVRDYGLGYRIFPGDNSGLP